MDFSKCGRVHAPISIYDAKVEMVENFLDVIITNNLSGTNHIEVMAEKSPQNLYYLKE